MPAGEERDEAWKDTKMHKLKWAFLGGKPEGIQTLRALSDAIGPPEFVCAPSGIPQGDIEDLEDACKAIGALLQERDSALVRLSEVDIALTQRFDILEKSAFQAPRLGVVNLHPSLLPLYRGVHPISWALIRGESQTGVTIHVIDEGIDTGPILMQSVVPIGVDDDIWSLTTKCADAATEIAKNLFLLISKDGALPEGTIQAGAGFYARRRTEEDSWFDPRSATPTDVFNLSRALRPPLPPARFNASDIGVVKILECLPPGAPGDPATGTARLGDGWTKLDLNEGTVIIRADVELPKTLDVQTARLTEN